MNREQLLSRTLVSLADTLVADFDLIELLTLLTERAVELLDVSAAGLVLADGGGSLQRMATTSETVETVELFQLQNHEGPCIDCYRSGEPVTTDDLSESGDRWPGFSSFVTAAGFGAAHSFPLRLRGQVLGAVNLYRTEAGGLSAADLSAARALADMAAISLCQSRAVRDAQVVAEQLRHALESRVAIEQAKGMLAERAGIGTDEAFARIRSFARATQRLLVDVAEEVVSGGLDPGAVLAPDSARGAARQEASR